jgi:hypothetical protein
MTTLLPELSNLPAEAVFDGEIVAFADAGPHFPSSATGSCTATVPYR